MTRLTYLLILVLFFFGEAPLRAVELNILFTSDQHGWLSSKLYSPKLKGYGLLHLEKEILRWKKKDKELLLLDGGDSMQGSPLVHYAHRFTPKQNPFLEKLEELGYDAIALGNHDLEENPYFERYDRRPNFWLAANAYRLGKNAFQPYRILQRKGLKIAILGLTTTGSHLWLPPTRLQGLQIKDLVTEGQRWVKLLKEKERPDLIILLLHSGLNPTRDDRASKLMSLPPANQSHHLLKELQGVTLALTGHDHRRNPYRPGPLTYVGSTAVAAGESRGKGLMHIRLELKQNQGSWQLQSARAEHIPPSQDPQILKTYQDLLPAGYEPWLNQGLPFQVISKDKEQLALCLNQSLANSIDQEGLDGSLLPIIEIKRNAKGRQITRRMLQDWIRYDNDWELVELTLRQIHLLWARSPQKQKKQRYNQRLYASWKNPPPTAQAGLWWPSINDFRETRRVALSSYHAQGGGGLAGKILLDQNQRQGTIGRGLRKRFFTFLAAAPSLPKVCLGVVRPIDPGRTKLRE